MIFILGFFLGAMTAGSAFVIGFACCMAMLAPKPDELQAAADRIDTQRESSIARLTPTIPSTTRTFSLAAH